MEIHVIRSGETLTSIAQQYGVSVQQIVGDNGLDANSVLVVGQALVIRFPAQTHTVEEGDTLYSVAADYGISVQQIYRNNYFLGGQNRLRPGDTLVISYRGEGEKLGTISANGYAYPYIDVDILDAALPYLTYLTPFTYGIGPEGELLPLNDGELLAAAGHYRTAGLMHLSTLTEEGTFSNERASALFERPDREDRLIDAIVQNLRRKSYYGLDVDFEYVYPQEREQYAAFVRKLRERLNPLGYPVIVALAPKTSAEQPGLLYEAHDYRLLGEAANAVFLMTYEWGYTYGPPMAVAPLPQVRAVIDYAVTEINPEKILLGIPIYGYDWALPYEQGVTKAESISPMHAMELAAKYGAVIQYDEKAQAPYFHYIGRSGRRHEVWFEDARSAQAKLRLISEYGLEGAGFWNLTRNFPQVWSVLDSMYRVELLI